MNPLCKYVCYLLAILLALATVGVFVLRGEVAVERKAREISDQNLAAYTTSATAVITERLAAQKATAAANAISTKETVTSYEKRIDLIHTAYAGRVWDVHPDSPAATAAVPLAPGGPAGADVATVLDDPIARFVGELRACEEDREKLIALQQWTRETR